MVKTWRGRLFFERTEAYGYPGCAGGTAVGTGSGGEAVF
jgi:hypothetical protein